MAVIQHRRDARELAPVGSYLRREEVLVRVLNGDDANGVTVENVKTGYPFSIAVVDLMQQWTRVTPCSDDEADAWWKQQPR